MEEQALSAALKAMRKGKCLAILDSKSRETNIDLFFPTAFSLPFL
jgi:3,4-dihydroxy-2-butanone 4-phosphate synthase